MDESKKLRDGIIILAGIALLLAFLRASSNIVVPFILSLFITIIAVSPLRWLKEHKVPNALSILIVIGGVIFTLALIGTMLGNTASEFNQALPGYQERLSELTTHVSSWLQAKGLKLDAKVIPEIIDPSKVMAFANTFVTGIVDVLSNIVLILFMVIFMLAEATGLAKKISSIGSDEALTNLYDIVNSINRYAARKSVVSIATGILIWLSLSIVGLDFAALWGVLAFILNFIPTIGSILAAVPAVLLAMVQFDPVMATVVVIIYLAINMIIGASFAIGLVELFILAARGSAVLVHLPRAS